MGAGAAFMAYEAMRKKVDYLKRGRPLAAVDTDELKGRWVAALVHRMGTATARSVRC
jgi:hypothetical protein